MANGILPRRIPGRGPCEQESRPSRRSSTRWNAPHVPGSCASRPKRLVAPPQPIAAWDFDGGLDRGQGELKTTLEGGATLTREGLRLDGKTGYAITSPLKQKLKTKTIEVWVQLDNLSQRGGGAISVQTLDGFVFDSIVFGEREPGRWMAGSDFFRRTGALTGAIETDAVDRADSHGDHL